MIPNVNLKHEMLRELGYDSIEELFSDIPKELRIDKLRLKNAKSELKVKREFEERVAKNHAVLNCLGGGGYHHHVPAAVNEIISRAEFYTSYTPYQPEISQGILQALFEYQSMIAELTCLPVANASLYDGATALGEVALMAHRINKKSKIIIPRATGWEKKSVLRNYTSGVGMEIIEVDYNWKSGNLNLGALERAVGKEVSAVYVENPNFFGIFEERIKKVRELAGESLLIMGVNPLSLGIAKPPGEYHADIAIGDAQVLGNKLEFGGGCLGMFACRKKYIRQAPGRIIGATIDKDGNPAYCMVLQTREQHIRRARATSNICTNEALKAIASATYLALLGSKGLRKLAVFNMKNARKLATKLNELEGWEAPIFKSTYFNEFVVRTKKEEKGIEAKLTGNHLLGGLCLEKYFPELPRCYLYCATELHTESDLNKLAEVLAHV